MPPVRGSDAHHSYYVLEAADHCMVWTAGCYITLHTVEELLLAAVGTLGSDASWKVTISAVTTGCCCSCSALVSLTPRSSAAI